MNSEIEIAMEDAELPEGDKQQVRFLQAWSRFKRRFTAGHQYTPGDIYDAFEAGAEHGRQYEPRTLSSLQDKEFGSKDPNTPTLIIPTQAALRQLAVAVQQYMNCPCAGHRLSVVTAQEEAGKWY